MRSIIYFFVLFVILTLSTVSQAFCQNCNEFGYCKEKDGNDTCLFCVCPSGFSGECCEINSPLGCDLDSCNVTNTGEQHFVCTNLPYGLRLCTCEDGWKGAYCDEEADGCDPNPCVNSRKCESMDNAGFRCDCKRDYQGDYCQTYKKCDSDNVNCGCAGNPCKNGGTCLEKLNGNYKCLCKNQSYTGKNCDEEPCRDNPCNHGGHCHTNPDGSSTCLCLDIWAGEHCENFNTCINMNCQNGGTCKVNGDNDTAECDCVWGYSGTYCENIIDFCNNPTNPCWYPFNGKNITVECTSWIGDYSCDCPPGTTGKNCNTNIDDCIVDGQGRCTQSDLNANCTDLLDGYICHCSSQYTGSNCSMSMVVWNAINMFGGSDVLIELMEEVVRQPSLIKDIMPFVLGQMPKENQSAMSWEYEDLFVWAAFEKTELTSAEIVKWYDTSLGNCFTFNHKESAKTYYLRRQGLQGGFQALMRVRQDEYLGWYDTAGLLVFVHPRDQIIFTESLRYQVPPRSSVSVVTNKVTYSRLNGKYGTCINDVSEVASYYYPGNYTTDGCLRACYQDAVQETCGCADPRYPMPESAVPCSISSWDCVNNVTEVKGDASNWDTCICPSPCHESQYESKWTASAFVSASHCNTSKKTVPYKKHTYCTPNYTDMALVNVFVPRLTQRVFQETPATSLNQFISYSGGLLGMFIGVSIVTAVELVYLVFLLLKIVYHRPQKSYGSYHSNV